MPCCDAIDEWRRGRAPQPVPAQALTKSSSALSYGLIALGTVMLIETMTGRLFSLAPVLVPLFLILAGGRLLFTYFRSDEART